MYFSAVCPEPSVSPTLDYSQRFALPITQQNVDIMKQARVCACVSRPHRRRSQFVLSVEVWGCQVPSARPAATAAAPVASPAAPTMSVSAPEKQPATAAPANPTKLAGFIRVVAPDAAAAVDSSTRAARAEVAALKAVDAFATPAHRRQLSADTADSFVMPAHRRQLSADTAGGMPANRRMLSMLSEPGMSSEVMAALASDEQPSVRAMPRHAVFRAFAHRPALFAQAVSMRYLTLKRRSSVGVAALSKEDVKQ